MIDNEKTSQSKNDFVWAFKYAPQKISDLILLDKHRKKFEKIVQTKHLPDTILYGPAGTGKTTLINVLKNELNLDMLYINGSLDSSIDVIRSDVKKFTRRASSNQKAVFIDECLEENETIRVGTVNEWKPVKLKHLPKDEYFDCISFNIETEKFENDLGIVHIEREADIFELELDDGRTIKVTDNHPFLVRDENNNIVEKSINDGLSDLDEIISL